MLIVWFLSASRALRDKRDKVRLAQQQMELHRRGLEAVRGTADERAARHILKSSSDIFYCLQEDYRKTLRQPIYRIPGLLFGYAAERKADEQDSL